MKKIVLPKGLTSIERWTFSGCEMLEEIILPEGITSIDNYAFDGCSRLKSIVVPENVQYIGNAAFSSCRALIQVIFTSEVPPIVGLDVFENCPGTLQILIPAGTMEAYSTALGWSEYVQYLVESTE